MQKERLMKPMSEKQREIQIVLVEMDRDIEDMESRLEVLNERRDKLKSECNHLYPDGTSAWEGGYFCSGCKICNYNDMGL